jgi:flavin reductase (DIM6/NTAB) family NADH-FMN oxidoreductase RutF
MTTPEKILIQPHSYGPDLYPVPVTLVTCENQSQPNIISICWTGVMCSNPPIVYISVRPERYSYGLIRTSEKFVINIPSGDMVETVDLCGKCSGRNTDKFEKFNLTRAYPIAGYPPVVAECRQHLFCDLQQVVALGTHHAFIGEVKHQMIDSDCLDGNTILFSKIRPIAYAPYHYAHMTDPVARFGQFRMR